MYSIFLFLLYFLILNDRIVIEDRRDKKYMKKKILFSLIVIALFFLSFTGVYAADGDTYTPTTKAKNISFTPASNASIVALMDNVPFAEFSKFVKFNAVGSVDQITPRSDLTKILISIKPNYEIAAAAADLGLSKKATEFAGDDNQWFSAYCLDASLKYPRVGLENLVASDKQTVGQLSANQQYDQLLANAVLMAFKNDKKFYNFINSQIKGSYNEIYSIAVKLDPTSQVTYVLGSPLVPASATPTDPNYLAIAAAGQTFSTLKRGESAKVYIESITVVSTNRAECYTETPPSDCAPKVINGKTIATDVDSSKLVADTYYEYEFTAKDILFDNYSVTKLGGDNTYNHALWIIEHSYPSMTIDDLLTSAGATKTDFVNEIMALYPNNTFTDDIKENLYDNYVYYTVQYAIWKANKYMPDGHELGDTLYLKGEANNTLNKIYQHLIKDRDEYKNYGNNKYSDKITFDKTNNDKIKTTKDAYIYGPYYASFDVINPGDINLEITNADKKGISIVDANEKELTKVPSGGEFYIKCLKSAKITNVSIKGTASGTSYDDSEKGAIYYANYALSQNVISGLKYMTIAGSGEDSFAYNPKTGVPNVAIVFIITLVAFSLGYLALSYNNKAVELN